MMTSAYILILAILLLGGLIAVLGDHLGSKVGKKRMRLFNLRPRQTATLVTVITGLLIAGSTLGVLFGLSKSLRQGVFELDSILKERRAAIRNLEKQLDTSRTAKKQVEEALKAAKTEQAAIQKYLERLNRNFQQSRFQLQRNTSQLQSLRAEIKSLSSDRQSLLNQKENLQQQSQSLQEKIQAKDRQLDSQENLLVEREKALQEGQTRLQTLEEKQAQLQGEVNQRDRQIQHLDQAIAQKDTSLNQREAKLQQLEDQMAFLRREVQVLEEYYQNYQELRESKIAIVKGQILAFGAFRIVNSQGIIADIDQLLTEANTRAIQATAPNNQDPEARVVKITKLEVEQLIKNLQEGQEYVVRILSAGNYVLGEKEVRVFADVAINQKVFDKEQEIAAISLDKENMSEEEIQKRLDFLLSTAQFRARSAGVLGAISLENGRLTQVIDFINKVSEAEDGIDEIKVIASDNTYTAGPLRLRLIALKEGEEIFTS
jgi:uncharacterized protein (DUF3084 family)